MRGGVGVGQMTFSMRSQTPVRRLKRRPAPHVNMFGKRAPSLQNSHLVQVSSVESPICEEINENPPHCSSAHQLTASNPVAGHSRQVEVASGSHISVVSSKFRPVSQGPAGKPCSPLHQKYDSHDV